ncbi:TatD family hydrolase [Egicoccus halophilus]|uniref:AraC family transcriptional regulator n=1 Tax=Egicoccus halophilus TaxID=1670830 RepID=A0A8J3ABW8_9ACTN|nr:TatD family hydrolase [Egicoccus halophilus]GGI03695.1 AraC family transcriptional regulator [Egicoccus halophilus]
MPYVDTHCHLDHHEGLSPAEQVERARAAGVRTMITVGTDMASSTQAVRTAARFDGVWAAVGVHPNDAMEATPPVLDVIDRLAQDERVVAVGETGMDYYREYTTPAQQEASFRAQIQIARERDRALVIHCREAWDDCLDVLEDEGAPERVVMHCFSGDLAVTKRCADRGWFLSFAGNLTFRNAQELRDAAAAAPLELLLTETDSPFLTPHPHRGKPNDPSYVPYTLRTLAEVQLRPVDEVEAAVERNAVRAFALPVDAGEHPR